MYGQKVSARFLGACDAFEMPEGKVAAGSEVYSSTELVRASVSDSSVIRRRMGPRESAAAEERYKFLDGRVLRKALATAASDSDKH